MLTVYHARRTRSQRIVWLLEELGLPYQLELMDFAPAALTAPAYLALNPLGRLPTLTDGDVVLTESGGIIEYVVARYGSGRLAITPQAPGFPAYVHWLHAGEAMVAGPIVQVLQHSRMRPEEKRVPMLVEEGQALCTRIFSAMEPEFAGKDYAAGASFSAADIQLGYTLHLAQRIKLLTADWPALTAYVARISARPAWQAAWGK
jgi:glutathione S-transferase